MPSAGSCCERQFHRPAGRCLGRAMGSCPDLALVLLFLVLAWPWRRAHSPFPTSLPVPAALHNAWQRSRGCQRKQFLQLNTARLLPGRSDCKRPRNGRKLTLHGGSCSHPCDKASAPTAGQPPTRGADPLVHVIVYHAVCVMVRAAGGISQTFPQLSPRVHALLVPATHFLTRSGWPEPGGRLG